MGVSVDLISNLPDEILHLILSSLPTTEEVIRTSILSKRWRYLWGLIPSVDIDCSRAGLQEFRKKEFKEFVFSVLINMSSNLDRFHLCCSNYYDTWTVVMWIYAGVLRHVKQLEFTFCPDENVKLPDGLLACDSLEVLKLFLFRRSLSLSNFAAGFSALRVLELNNVELFAGDVEKFFKTCCPLLEDLSLLDCFMYKLDCLCISSPSLKTLRIDNRNLVDSASLYKDYEKQGLCIFLVLSCQKLVYLEYGGHIADEFLFKLPSLKKAVIYPTRDILHQQKEITPESGDPIFLMLCEVFYSESLSINYYVLQCINAVDDCLESLPNLKTLELRTKLDAITMNVLNNILSCAPNLLSLHLIIQKGFSLEEFQTLARELDEGESKRFFTRYLKRVEFIEFNGEKEMLSVAQFLLKHGNALEEMVFSWDSKVKYQEKSTETINEVSKFYKASSFVKLVTFVNEQ